jgi:hypothetical protein
LPKTIVESFEELDIAIDDLKRNFKPVIAEIMARVLVACEILLYGKSKL